MKVAVTGGSGQLGTLVLRRLLRDRDVAAIVSLDRRPPVAFGRKLTAILADVRDPQFERYLVGCDALIHSAFIVDRYERRSVMDEINVQGSRNVFRAARSAAVRKLVHLSSIAAYGVVPGHPRVVLEESPRYCQPGFAYAANKYAVEAFLDDFERDNPDIAVVRLRPGMLVGVRMDNLFGRFLKRRLVPFTSDVPLPIVWDEDVADAVMLGLKKPVRGAFNLAADDPLPPRELAAAVDPLRALPIPRALALVHARISPLLAKVAVTSFIDPGWIVDKDVRLLPSSEKARTRLGWRPQCGTAVDVMRRYCEFAPGRIDRRVGLFMMLVGMASGLGPRQDQLAGARMTIHLSLTGSRGGDFSVTVKDGRVGVRPGVPRPPTALVAMTTETFRALLSGESDWAAAQLTGKIQVDGEAAAMLVITGLITAFRARTRRNGPLHVLDRAIGRWFEHRSSQ